MKLSFLCKLFLSLLILGFSACRNAPAGNESVMPLAIPSASGDAAAQPTVIYLVRHAEKDLTDSASKDPGLTPQGVARAEALRAELEGQPIAALYATKYIRTQQTLQPLAIARQLPIQPYDTYDFNGLKDRILQEHKGQTVVVAGHSNTLLPLIKAFGAKTDVLFISDSEYDYLFKITVLPGNTATVEVRHYGATGR
ncbi:histidine phosphatase family protein [Pontibacter liquoris]|uniref:histidine phosphatase family protein n=1 Tax=Pontibacter liquoris TaxID=2905677 RepID=UPI001FA71068|nr:histidine phosphatase family protein [Pontibacter liquoris]